jgi:hypothetical protein
MNVYETNVCEEPRELNLAELGVEVEVKENKIK